MGNWNKAPVTEKWEASELITQAIDRHRGHIYVAWSGGKSSTVVLMMAWRYWPEIPVMFCNTGVEMPETVEYVHAMRDKWNLNLIETQPYKKSFWDCVDEYGVPGTKTDGSKVRPKCCYYLKHKPAELAAKEHGFNAVLTGIQAGESYGRHRLITFCGQRYMVKKTGMWQYHPIAFWDNNRVWKFIKDSEIPYNPAYDKYPDCQRTGCWPCSSYKGWEKRLAKQNPKLCRIMMNKMGQNTLEPAPKEAAPTADKEALEGKA